MWVVGAALLVGIAVLAACAGPAATPAPGRRAPETVTAIPSATPTPVAQLLDPGEGWVAFGPVLRRPSTRGQEVVSTAADVYPTAIVGDFLFLSDSTLRPFHPDGS